MDVTKIVDQTPPAHITISTCAKPIVQDLLHPQQLYNKQAPQKLDFSPITNVSPPNAKKNAIHPIQPA